MLELIYWKVPMDDFTHALPCCGLEHGATEVALQPRARNALAASDLEVSHNDGGVWIVVCIVGPLC